MPFIKKQFDFLKKQAFYPKNKNILLAISGGMDSMCLLHFWIKTAQPFFKCTLFVAHLNHGLRKESEEEACFLKSFCKTHNLIFFYQTLDVKKKEKKESLEEWGRRQRYTYFSQISKKHNIHHTLTAHHLNDQWETLILNILRGTSLKGLQGIHFKTQTQCVRPFLIFSKQELLTYANQHQITWFEDSTNSNSQFLRNSIRKTIPASFKNLQSVLKITLEAQKQWPSLEKMFEQNLDRNEKKLSIPHKIIEKWFSTNPWLYFHDLQYFVLKQGVNMKSKHLEEMIRQYQVSPYLVQIQLNFNTIFKWQKRKPAHIFKIEIK